MEIPRVRVLLTCAHTFLIMGSLLYTVTFFFTGMSVILCCLVPLVLLTPTPLYIAALWADKTDKYLNPKYRWVWWLCAFAPIMLIGFYEVILRSLYASGLFLKN